MKRSVLCVPGFGVDGLMLELAREPGFTLIDPNVYSAEHKTMTVPSLVTQAEQLKAEAEWMSAGRQIDIVAHSQGCLVIAHAMLNQLGKVVLVAPTNNVNVDGIADHFATFSGSFIDQEGESWIPGKGDSTIFIPQSYWDGLRSIDVNAAYLDLKNRCDVTVIEASDDEVLDEPHLAILDGLVPMEILPGNHNFTGEDRPGLITLVQKILSD